MNCVFCKIQKLELPASVVYEDDGANLFLSDGSVAGQDVMHSDLHIVPRFSGDGQRIGFRHASSGQFSRDQLDLIAARIVENLVQRGHRRIRSPM